MSREVTNDNNTVRSSELKPDDFIGVEIDSKKFILTRTSMGKDNFLITNLRSVYGRYDGLTINSLVSQLLEKKNTSAVQFESREGLLEWLMEEADPDLLKS